MSVIKLIDTPYNLLEYQIILVDLLCFIVLSSLYPVFGMEEYLSLWVIGFDVHRYVVFSTGPGVSRSGLG